MKKSLLILFLLANAALGYSQISFSALSTSSITGNTASLNAYVTINCANGGNFHAQYSTSPSFATFTTASGGSVFVSYARTINISGLLPGVTYYWRYYGNLGANCNQSVIYSPTQTFTTPNMVPTLPTISNIAVNNGSISYVLNPNNAATTSIVRFGPAGDNLLNALPGFTAPAETGTSGSVDLSSMLQQGNVYFYQIEATNSAGTTTSATASFFYGTVTPHYTFDNTYNNISGTNPFSSNSGTSFTTDRHGNISGALKINNTGSTATINGLSYGAAARTVSVWVKINAFNGGGYNFIYCYGNGSNFNGAYMNASSVFYFAPSSNHTIVNSSGAEWNHFVFVYDGSNSKIYKNGVLLGTSARVWNTANNNNLFTLGLSEGGATGFFDGAIDDLKIYNYALSQPEITSLFTNNALSTEELEPTNLTAVIYPNPASDTFTIAMDNEVKGVGIYSLQGQKVLTSVTKEISVSGLSKGIYLVRIEDQNSAVSTQKLIVK